MLRIAKSNPTSPYGLLDSHITLVIPWGEHEVGAAFHGLELEPTLKHDDRTRLAVIAGYYGKPGPVVMLQGWLEFQAMKRGAHLMLPPRDNQSDV
ncbi:hypothetical protein [Bradyrhizobium sp. WBOS04]|uniref:hypothetical protein n=1 Tax=Bradyrhizobium sp. WBOS04 TaxID=2171498 RepID=UPI00211F2716|nr:hypothetical protein [Bradyrhizobium sp. WBOS04]UUO47747.1 hypothetical protein DCM78_12940 [Bradyrhizobium sp. WBOS04]